MLQRPAKGQHCEFCNCSSYSDTLVDLNGTEHAYDRLLLAAMPGDLCPPSFRIKDGECQDALRIPKTVNGEVPCCWFLKENGRNFGLSIIITATASEALAAAKTDAEYVLQPHIVRPMLFGGRKFHIRVYALLVVAPTLRYPRALVYDGCKLSISSKKWSANDFDKKTQVTTKRSPEKYADWEHHDACHPALMASASELLVHVEKNLAAVASADSCAFELLGLDYMVDEDFRPWLLEVNTGPVLKDVEDMPLMRGIVDIVFGPEETPLFGQACGTGPVRPGAPGHVWLEVNSQEEEPGRREALLARVVKWLREPERDDVMLDEIVEVCCRHVRNCTSGPDAAAGWQAAIEAGVVEALVATLPAQDLPCKTRTLAMDLLCELCAKGEGQGIERLESAPGVVDGLLEMLQTSDVAQELAGGLLALALPGLPDDVLTAEMIGKILGVLLYQLAEAANGGGTPVVVAERAADCVGTLCDVQRDFTAGTAVKNLGGLADLRTLAVEAHDIGLRNAAATAVDAIEHALLAEEDTRKSTWKELSAAVF
jgi:hypothetical protein